jgi:hypothetical protein
MADKDTPQAKLDIKIGNVSFMGEGDQTWLSEQLAKVIAAVPAAQSESVEDGLKNEKKTVSSPKNVGSLASYIKAKGGESKQILRFLAAAAWLYIRGERELSAKIVAKALAENHQKKLANPADCLNQSVKKGHCEKTPDGFFITPEGWTELGEEQQ